MLAITIVLFVVPHNQQIVTIRQLFTCRIPLFRNQNLNIQEKGFEPPFLQHIYLLRFFIPCFINIRTHTVKHAQNRISQKASLDYPVGISLALTGILARESCLEGFCGDTFGLDSGFGHESL